MDSEKRNTNYNMYVDAKLPKTKFWQALLKSFVAGGIICCIGQLFYDL